MIKVICIKDISSDKLEEFNRTKDITYFQPLVGYIYEATESCEIFEKDKISLTKDKHNFIFHKEVEYCYLGNNGFLMLTIPEVEFNNYFISLSQHRENIINEIFEDL